MADLVRVLLAVAILERSLEVEHAAHVLEPGERGLDVAVEVGADRDVVERSRELADPVDVTAEGADRVLEEATRPRRPLVM